MSMPGPTTLCILLLLHIVIMISLFRLHKCLLESSRLTNLLAEVVAQKRARVEQLRSDKGHDDRLEIPKERDGESEESW
jgi:hypothetical protein